MYTPTIIPKEITGGEELVIIRRRKFEELIDIAEKQSELILTTKQRKALIQGRKNRKAGKFLTNDEPRSKLRGIWY